MAMFLKFFITVFLSVFSVVAVAADGTPLENFYSGLSGSCTEIRYSYAFTVNGIKNVGEGDLCLQGRSYVLRTNGLEIFSNGKDVWVADMYAKEMTVSTVEELSYGSVSDPVLLLSSMNEIFRVAGQTAGTDGATVIYEMLPREDCGVDKAVLEIRKKDAILTKAGFSIDGNMMEISIDSMKHLPLKDASVFSPSFDYSDSSWIVSDIR